MYITHVCSYFNRIGKDQKSRDLALAQLKQEIMLESPVSQCLPQLLDNPDA
ncbi:unnamed protein product, partial [Rotaria sp. Silwood1]